MFFSSSTCRFWRNPHGPLGISLLGPPGAPPGASRGPRAGFQVWLQAALSREEDKCTKTASEANWGSARNAWWGLKRFGILKLTKDNDNDSPMIMIMTNWWLIMTWVIVKLWQLSILDEPLDERRLFTYDNGSWRVVSASWPQRRRSQWYVIPQHTKLTYHY